MLKTWNIVFQYINKECLDSVSAFAEEKQSWQENNLNISNVNQHEMPSLLYEYYVEWKTMSSVYSPPLNIKTPKSKIIAI